MSIPFLSGTRGGKPYQRGKNADVSSVSPSSERLIVYRSDEGLT